MERLEEALEILIIDSAVCLRTNNSTYMLHMVSGNLVVGFKAQQQRHHNQTYNEREGRFK